MRQIIVIFLLLLMPIFGSAGVLVSVEQDVSAAGKIDSSRFAVLAQKLSEYYGAMHGEPVHVQQKECDFLIESTSDTSLRQFIAQNIYDHYIGSPVMGSENVAVYVFDKWFSGGKLEMKSPKAYSDAKTYADFNRESLVGMDAPYLRMETPDGEIVELFPHTSDNISGMHADYKTSAKGNERFSVLYFYDTDCAKCSVETMLLRGVFNKRKYPVRLYAIYVGDNRQAWEKYRGEKLALSVPETEIIHLWDPELHSGFQKKYGMTQTPRLFLVGPDGVILGRGLDAQALDDMLESIFAEKVVEYGTREGEELFDGIFAQYDGRPSAGAVKGIADYIHDRTLSSADTSMFKQLAGDYLYYLSARYGEGFKEGLRYHIDKNILSKPDVWKSSDDTLRIVGYARIMDDLLSKGLPGTKVPDMKVPGELYTWHSNKSVLKRLDKLPGKENIIILYTEGCEVCAAEKAAALSKFDSLSGKGGNDDARAVSVFMVNMDALMGKEPALATRLMDSFDLSSLPFIFMTDRKGIIRQRYMSLAE